MATTTYRDAMDATLACIGRRGRVFRSQILSVALFIVAVLVVTGFSARPLVLITLLLLMPICGVFALLDSLVVARWRRQILESWQAASIDLHALRHALEAIPHLPGDTLKGMMATLPSWPSLSDEHQVVQSVRVTMAASILTEVRADQRRLGLKVLGITLVCCALVTAVLTERWTVAALAAGGALLAIYLFRRSLSAGNPMTSVI